MPQHASPHPPPDGYDAEALRSVIGLAEELGRTLCIAHVLVEHGRPLDLTGLDRGIGLLCAKSLDLPQSLGRQARPHLVVLLAEADRLTASLRTVGTGPARDPAP